jgi:phosphatidylglycerophosphate synthase
VTAVVKPAQPTAADFRARRRSAGLFTDTVSQRLGSYLSVAAYRLGLHPTVLTLTNLVLGVGAVVLVGGLAPLAHEGRISPVWMGLGALVLWHLAYALDCADGQLARFTGKAGPAGARVDILCDVALQIALVAVVATVSRAYHPSTPAWLVAVFAGTWMVNLVTSVLQQGSAGGSLITRDSAAVKLVKLVRDYGAVVTVIGLVLAFVPQWTVGLMVAFVAVNGGFLFASIAAAARASMRAGD